MPPQRPKKKVRREAEAGPSSLRKTASVAKTRKPIALKDIKWKSIDVPSLSLASGPDQQAGTRDLTGEFDEEDDDWDPFADLDEGADDFMGLQEVTGVGVRIEGDDKRGKTVGFYLLQDDDLPEEQTIEPEIAVKSSLKKRKQDKAAKAEPAKPTAVQQEDDEEEEWIPAATPEPEKQDGMQLSDPEDEGSISSSEEDDAIPQGIFAAFADDAEADQENTIDIAGSSALPSASDNAALSAWPQDILNGLHPMLKRSISRLGFTKPTPIQSASLPFVLPPADLTARPRDVVALAQTGSGKTLAYALPILQKCLAARSTIFADEDGEEERPLQALIVLPTRELAMQVYDVFQKIIAAAVEQDDDDAPTSGKKGKSKAASWVRIAPVMGGMSEERQWRLLRGRKGAEGAGKGAEIIIATVGRLWELCKSDDYLPSRLETAETLVLDEADRLLETGKFQELSSVLELLQSPRRQTMMFSATLDPTLQVNLSKSRSKIAKAMKRSRGDDQMIRLIERVGFTDEEGVKLIDLTRGADLTAASSSTTAGHGNTLLNPNLRQGKIECLEKEKDIYLYYLLLRYPGSTLVFVNSIDSVRRLTPLLTNLKIQCFQLHGQMEQRTRLRSLDAFKKSISNNNNATSVLLTTDVAARGIDIPLVSHVFHFHLPREAAGYIHRSGRTARAGQTGLSLIFLSPNEGSRWNALKKNLQISSSSTGSDDIPILDVNYGLLTKLKSRVALAKELDEVTHRTKKEKRDQDWIKNMAEEAEIGLDDEESDPDADHVKTSGSSKKMNKKVFSQQKAAIASLQSQLDQELNKDLMLRGLRRKYITAGAGLGLGEEAATLQGLIDGSGHETFLGLGKTRAEEELGKTKGGSGFKSKRQKR